ncbi:UDP-glucose/GDP-mannose dehydrogenase family protein [Paenibacillus sp. OV219]|uniref:UDP-glucose dehydrogenase family protein n=1 Tax=Paenibacillus sp. OV219 TaxID=1884377 RepID=UPI0008AE0279|nr:UDP-glucose/GDP-mannose dehydrogenase family protein [Paenibacillus sp. OV219]SEO64345.1 UDPglucose 6-dehydrogenase [Paenibacillus sp. OV219]
MKIAVAGTGYVGLVAGVCLAEVGHQVTCVDIDETKVKLMEAGVSPVYEAGLEEMMQKNYNAGRLAYTTDYKAAYRNADAIFIGVGTPEQPDGSANLSYIATVAKQIAESVESDCLVVVKSTVPVGTNDKVEQFIRDFLVNDVRVEVASNPEFLSQGSAVQDTLHAERIIIGVESKWAEEMLKQIYQPFQLPIVSVNRRSAEMIKYAANNFLALKISYMNDIANLCELVGADIQDVARGMSYDERIGGKFLNAGIGYGGSCFPKDTKALEYIARQKGYELKTVKAAIDVNKEQKTILYKKASQRLITFNGLKVAVLGLTFKPGTDDLREAASLENVPLLLAQGADIYAYDPVGVDNFAKVHPEGKNGRGSITYVDHIEHALEGANVCFIFTEWGEVKALLPEAYKKLMRTPLVFDGRNMYSVAQMQEAGVEYHSIGRKSASKERMKESKNIDLQYS